MGMRAPGRPIRAATVRERYGCHLHGSEVGSVDAANNVPGTPILEGDSARAGFAGQRMDQPPYHLDQVLRDTVLQAIQEVCAHRGWSLLAVRQGASGSLPHWATGTRVTPAPSDEPVGTRRLAWVSHRSNCRAPGLYQGMALAV